VARSGVDGVSTREILLAARADSAAIHYHFGSKDALMAAVFKRRVNLLSERVARQLAQRTAEGVTLSVRDLAEAIVLPFAALGQERRSGAQHYLGFVVALLNYPPLAHMRSEGDPWIDLLLQPYAQMAPGLSDLDRRRRIGFAAYVAIGALANGPAHAWFEDKQMQAPGAMVDALIDFLSSGLTPGA
jgi:AcrR family transcriptional regulator